VGAQGSTSFCRCISVRKWFKGRGEQVLVALVITLVLMGLAALIPAIAGRLSAQPLPTPRPTPSATEPPAAVLLPEELDKDLLGVMTIVNDHTFGTAFLIDAQGDLLTASSLVSGSASLRLIDTTGGMHAVRVLGTDQSAGIAMLRAAADGTPELLGDSTTVEPEQPLALLANAKVLNLSPSTPAVVSDVTVLQVRLRVDDTPGNLGGPIAGPGGKVLAMLTATGTALPINRAQADIAAWRTQPGTMTPLAPFPNNLVLRGSDTTATPPASPSGTATVQSVSPSRVSAARDTVVTVQGSGFVPGPALHVRFVPVAGSDGAFDGMAATLVNPSSLTVKVPAGRIVQDYVIQFTNGDGTVVNTQIALTVTP
jgi:S1-C subfamily serine protease